MLFFCINEKNNNNFFNFLYKFNFSFFNFNLVFYFYIKKIKKINILISKLKNSVSLNLIFYVGSLFSKFNFFNKLKYTEFLIKKNNINNNNNGSFLYFFDGFFFPFNTHQGFSLRYFNLNHILKFKQKKIQKRGDFSKKYNFKILSTQNKDLQKKTFFNNDGNIIKTQQHVIRVFSTKLRKKNKFKFKKRRF
jgi:hypothetical protein